MVSRMSSLVLTLWVTFASPELSEAGPPLLHSAGREGRSEQHPAFFTSSHAVTPCLSCSQQHLPGNPFPAAPRWSFKSFERLSLKFLHRNHCLMFTGGRGGSQPVSNKGDLEDRALGSSQPWIIPSEVIFHHFQHLFSVQLAEVTVLKQTEGNKDQATHIY